MENHSQGTAADVNLEDLPHENMKEGNSPWQFKKVSPDERDSEGIITKRMPFKAYTRGTDVLFPGFEDMEWKSPLEGGRYINTFLREAEHKAKEAAAVSASTFTVGGQHVPPVTGSAGDSIKSTGTVSMENLNADQIAKAIDRSTSTETDEARERTEALRRTGKRRMFRIVIPKQSNTDMNRPVCIPNHEGGADFKLKRGQEYTVPEYVVSIIKESIQTSTECAFETTPQTVRTNTTFERIPRLSLNILGEVWL